MWDLDYKESRAPRNWCFWTVVLEKTLESPLDYKEIQPVHSKASILQRSAFFTVQLSHPRMTTGKTIDLIRWTFVCNVMSLLFNMLSRFVIAFLSRSKPLLISWLQSLSTVILESAKIKSVTVSTFSPSVCLEGMGTYLHFLNVEF